MIFNFSISFIMTLLIRRELSEFWKIYIIFIYFIFFWDFDCVVHSDNMASKQQHTKLPSKISLLRRWQLNFVLLILKPGVCVWGLATILWLAAPSFTTSYHHITSRSHSCLYLWYIILYLLLQSKHDAIEDVGVRKACYISSGPTHTRSNRIVR